MMYKHARLVGAMALALSMGASHIALAADLDFVPAEPQFAPVWQPWLELGGRASSELSGGHATLFVPWTLSPESLVFLELRGKLLEKDVREGNVALGYRQMLANGWNLGLWGGYDVRHTRHDNTFDQVSGGIELLHPNWDLRVNGHVALDDEKFGGGSTVFLEDTSIFMFSREELPLSGIDGEIGWRLPVGGLDSRHEVRVYGGGYHFDRGSADQAATGPKGRLEWRINDVIPQMPGSRLTLEAGISHDKVRDTEGFAGINLRIPFGNPPTPLMAHSPQSRRMIDPLVRQDLFVASSTLQEDVEDALTDVAFTRVAFVGDGGSITDTSAEQGDETLIIVDGGTIAGPQELQGNQTLQGGGSTIEVRGQQSGNVALFTAPGTQPTLNAPGDAPNLTLLGSNTHVAGLAIEGAGQFSELGGNTGIMVGSDQQNVFIGLSEIFDTGDEGIHIGDRNEVTIYSTEFRNIGDDAIDVNGDDNTVTITDVTTLDTNSEGLDLNGTGNTVTVANVSITNAGDNGIELGNGNTFTMEDSTISNTDEHGIEIGTENTVTINTTTIEGYGDDGIRIDGSANTVDIADSTIRDGADGDDGVDINGRDNTVDLDNVTIADADDEGFDIDGLFNTVTIANSTITGSGDDGIAVGDDGEGNHTVTLTNSLIDGTGGDGILIAEDSDNNTVHVVDSTIRNTGDDGFDIEMGSDGNSVMITNSTIQNVDDGIDIDGSNNSLTVTATTIADTDGDGIDISEGGNGNTIEVDDSEIRDVAEDGIEIDSDNNTVVFKDSTIDNAGDDGIDSLDGDDNDVTVTGSTISNTGDNGITIGDFNTYTISTTTIMNTGIGGGDGHGIRMENDNVVSLDDSIITGNIAGSGIRFDSDGNTLSGDGNTAEGATFGDQFCDAGGFLQTGLFSFLDDGTGNPGTCP